MHHLYFCVSLIILNHLTVTHTTSLETRSDVNYSQEEGPKFDQIKTGIAGGKNVSVTSANYVGIIYYVPNNGILGSVVILNRKWVLTTAYNVFGFTPTTLGVIVGSTEFDKGTQASVDSFYRHSAYQGGWNYDLALVKLKHTLTYSRKIQPISLSSTLPTTGEKAELHGYGNDKLYNRGHLKRIVLPYMSFANCKSYYETSKFTQLSFCTSASKTGPCAFDWGSPLVWKKKLIGIFIQGSACGNTKKPAIYADITRQKTWINNIIQSHTSSDEDAQL